MAAFTLLNNLMSTNSVNNRQALAWCLNVLMMRREIQSRDMLSVYILTRRCRIWFTNRRLLTNWLWDLASNLICERVVLLQDIHVHVRPNELLDTSSDLCAFHHV
jgi:hypothetical protein